MGKLTIDVFTNSTPCEEKICKGELHNVPKFINELVIKMHESAQFIATNSTFQMSKTSSLGVGSIKTQIVDVLLLLIKIGHRKGP